MPSSYPDAHGATHAHAADTGRSSRFDESVRFDLVRVGPHPQDQLRFKVQLATYHRGAQTARMVEPGFYRDPLSPSVAMHLEHLTGAGPHHLDAPHTVRCRHHRHGRKDGFVLRGGWAAAGPPQRSQPTPSAHAR
jgi:hypothetical protein